MAGKSKNVKVDRQTNHPQLDGDTVVQKEDPSIIVAQIARTSAIVVGVITLIGVIVTAVLNFPPLVRYFEPVATPTIMLSPPFSFTPSPLPSVTPEVPMTPSLVPATETPFIISPSPEPPRSKMIVRLQANMTSGKAPLLITFDACNSFMELNDGSTWKCSPNLLCSYTWAVYKESKQVGNPVQGQGKFSYKFVGKGTYFVTVYVCRGDVCNGSGIPIEIK